MNSLLVGLIVLVAVVLLLVVLWLQSTKKKTEQENKNLQVLQQQNQEAINYIRQQKEEAERVAARKAAEAAVQKKKLELYKNEKERIENELKAIVEAVKPLGLNDVLQSHDKGVPGIYILDNVTKDKQYVGQSKQLFKRIKEHFKIEDIAADWNNGDDIQVKVIPMTSLPDDVRIDLAEKSLIEIFETNTKGYNKTVGNL